MTYDAAIIGGGVSGLVAADALCRRGCRVIVLERQRDAGGNAVSERVGGFLMEHGPSTVNARSQAACDLSQDLGLGAERCDLGAGIRRRYLVDGGRLRGISAHPMGFLLSGYLSFAGRARLVAEVAVPRRRARGAEEESVADFCRRRFGGELVARVVDPLVGGLYAGRAAELSVQAVFPKLVELEREHGSVALGVMRSRRKAGRMPGSRLFSWMDGVGSLPGALAARLGSVVRTGVAVRRLSRTGDGFAIDVGAAGTVTARSIIVATQPHVAAGLLEGLDGEAATAAAEIAAPPLAVVFLGYKRRQVEHPLDSLGFLSPEGEGRRITGAQFCSTMFPGRAPEGHVAVSAYIGGARAPDLARLPSDDLIGLVRGEFRDLIGACGDPVTARVRHWPVGLPQYRIGHGRRLAAIHEASRRVPGLFVTGNYFNGPSIAECIARSLEMARKTGDFLAGAGVGAGIDDTRDMIPSPGPAFQEPARSVRETP